MKTFLAISPHPDDVDFGCAGTICKLIEDGNRVEELIVSDGSKGSHVVGFDGNKLADMREKEQRAAAAVLGVQDVRFLEQVDGEMENTRALRKLIVREVRRVKPDVVLSFDPSSLNFEDVYLAHRDHRMVAEAVFDALYPAAGSISFFPELIEQGFPPHKSKEIWFFSTPKPNHFVDITETFKRKMEALSCHKCQIPDLKALEKEMKKSHTRDAKRAGKRGGSALYAESFRVVALD